MFADLDPSVLVILGLLFTAEVTAKADPSKPGTNWKHVTGCAARGAVVGATGALAVGGLVAGAMALGAPAAVVTGVLLVGGGVGGGFTLASTISNISNRNYAGLAYDLGSVA